ncbi:Vacuolar protein sorting-associated protein 17 [Nakaseomyces bracarensis]|uniref:Vacuolar protein sorting-associated protein 17 n=1 Tax=Nakaseomyces bracarensis TaxID=273131 RepID=A0ABR4NPB8_9SACH
MSSAVSYEPEDEVDDVLDNNPFQEPIEPTTTNSTDNENENENGHGNVNEEESTQQPDTDNEEQQKAKEKKRKEMLEKLLPERFATGQKYQLITKVSGLERVGSSANKRDNPTIIFDVTTDLPTFRKKSHKKVRKTIEEFRYLFKYLNAAVPESFIPSLPPTYTHFGINTKDDYKKVVSNFQLWFDRISSNPLILQNEELAFFIECDFDTYYPVNQYKSPISGLKRKTMKQFAPPYDEFTELAEFRPLIKSIYTHCDAIQEKLLKVSRVRKALVEDENLYGKCFVEINDNNSLYRRYGHVMTTVGDIDSIIASLDMATLYDGLTWVVRDTYVVKESLTNRHFLMKELIKAQGETKTKQEQVRKIRTRRDNSPLKVEEATRSLRAAHDYETELSKKLNRVTQNMLIERKQWLKWYDDWFRSSVRSYVLKRIEYERKKLTLLERVRTEVRKADPNGGLSRLGRPHVRKHMQQEQVDSEPGSQSQSLLGDSWTGDHRVRNQDDLSKFLTTEFDITLNEEERHQESLDAKNAASLLGTTTF